MPTVVSTDTNAAKKSAASMARSFRLRENFFARRSLTMVGRRAPTGAPKTDAASIIGSLSERRGAPGSSIPDAPEGETCVTAGPLRRPAAVNHILASRAIRSSILTPTSATPPNTVPFLPLARCSLFIV